MSTWYSKLNEIKTEMVNTGVFPTGHVYLGQEFTVSVDRAPFCIIKQGAGNFQGRSILWTAYVMALFHDAAIESLLAGHFETVVRAVARVDNVTPIAATTDSDIFEPFGIVIPPVPPWGGFRLDLNLHLAG